MTHTATPDLLHDDVHGALARAVEAQDALLEHATRLVEQDDLSADGLGGLTEATETREAALRELGAAVLAWVRMGGMLELLELVEPDPADSQAPGGDPLPGRRAPPHLQEVRTEPEDDTDTTEVDAPDAPPVDDTGSSAVETGTAPVAGPAHDTGLDTDDDTEEVAIAPAPPLAEPADIAALAARWRQRPSLTQPPRPRTSPFDRLGPLPDLSSLVARESELTRLESEVRTRAGWDRLPRSSQRAVVAHVAARARALQAHAAQALSSSQQRRLDGVFSALTHFQETARPGYVHGLQRSHLPRLGTWHADAAAALQGDGRDTMTSADELLDAVEAATSDGSASEVVSAIERAVHGGVSSRDSRLLTLAAPFRALLEETGRCKTLRKALAAAAREAGSGPAGNAPDAAEPDPDGSAGSTGPVDPEVLAHTRDKRALIIGGDRLGRIAPRLKAALGLRELDWESGHNDRRVASMGERVQAGSYDLVIFVRGFLSHKVTDILLPSVKAAAEILTVWCDRGSGLPAIERAVLAAADPGPAAR